MSSPVILEHLSRVLASEPFRSSERSRQLLAYLVERTLAGQTGRLKEYTIGVEALGRGDTFDPRVDPIVRAEASRLRRRLEQYYRDEGSASALMIVLPRGSYAPLFESRPLPEARAPAQALSANRAGLWRLFGLGILAGAGVLAAALWLLQPAIEIDVARVAEFDVELRSGGTLGSDVGTDIVIAPDSTRVVFVARSADRRGRLYTRRLDDSFTTELPGTDGARAPFFSPDGRWVGFWADGVIKKIALDGGAPVRISDSIDLLGASWGPDDEIIAATSFGVLSRVPAAGGPLSTVLDLSGARAGALWPQHLPGRDQLMITVLDHARTSEGSIEILSLHDGGRQMVVSGGTFGRYVDTRHGGFVLYVSQGTLFALPFDLQRRAARAAAFPVLDGVAYAPPFGYAQLDVSAAGMLVYRREPLGGPVRVAWVDRSGRIEPLALEAGRYSMPRLSPDGQKLALGAIDGGVATLLLYEPGSGQRARLLATGHGSSVWSRSGKGMVLGGPDGLAWLRVDGDARDVPPRALPVPGLAVPWSMMPDGSRVAFHNSSTVTHFDIWTLPLTFSGEDPVAGTPEPFLRTADIETWPALSPDGQWLAYGSNESGAFEVYVRAFPDDGSKVQVSVDGGRIPTWSRNGRELLYGTDEGRVMVADYRTQGRRFVAGKPQAWTPVRLAESGVRPAFDLAPDGERIVALLPTQAVPTPDHATFVFNFFEKLRPQR